MITSGTKYKKLIARCALRPLRSEEDLDIALEISEELLMRLSSLDDEEVDYLEVLGDLVEKYEDVHHSFDDEPEPTPAEMLSWLMEVNGMKQVDLAKVLGVTSGRASEIANGVRELSKAQILMVAERFNVRADMFLSKKPKTASKGSTGSKGAKAKAKMAVGGKYRETMAKPSAARGVAEAIGPHLTKKKKATGADSKRKAK